MGGGVDNGVTFAGEFRLLNWAVATTASKGAPMTKTRTHTRHSRVNETAQPAVARVKVNFERRKHAVRACLYRR